jgi:YesN/AraC family two-component response regulator
MKNISVFSLSQNTSPLLLSLWWLSFGCVNCADELNLSANYFGDFVKKETGKTAQEYILSKIIEVAKERISDVGIAVGTLAYSLGFKYPQHFTRLFKQRAGAWPNEFRMLN